MSLKSFNLNNKFTVYIDDDDDNEYDDKYYMKTKSHIPIKTVVLTMNGILTYIKKNCKYEDYLRVEQFFIDETT